MLARDHGCTFPGCDTPAAWTEAHHTTPYRQTQRTSVDDGTLPCPHHHTHFEAMGWQSIMHNGTPHWITPPWLDNTRTSRRNPMHDW